MEWDEEAVLRLSSISLLNLKLSDLQKCELTVFPEYLNWKTSLFPAASKLSLVPANEFPKELDTESLDAALKSHLLAAEVLNEDSLLIVPVRLECEKWFNAAFSIIEADFSQFVIDANTLISIASLPKLCQLPPHTQLGLIQSWKFPQSHLFTRFPDASQLNRFLGSESLSCCALYGQIGTGKRTLIARCLDELGFPSVDLDLEYFGAKIQASKLVDSIQNAFKKGARVVVFDSAELLKPSFKFHSFWHQIDKRIKLIFIFHTTKLADSVRDSFQIVQELKNPSRSAALQLFQELQTPDCSIDLAGEFSGFALSVGEFQEVASTMDYDAFKSRLQLRRKLLMASSEIPKVTWDQVAGLQEAKETLSALITKISHRPRPSGILLHGPPGTGKTLLAKALATQSDFSFLAVKGPELLSPYIGESEAALRDVFAQARSQAPCIIFFDELDALVPKRGEFGDSVGVADRLVSTFMLEMDEISGLTGKGIDENCVIVIGATNRPDLIDSSLLRSGRFDLSLFLGPPTNVSERAAILEASCRGFRCCEALDYEAVFKGHEKVQLSPAQIASIAKIAAEQALERKIASFKDSENNENLFSYKSAEYFLIDPLNVDGLREALIQVICSK